MDDDLLKMLEEEAAKRKARGETPVAPKPEPDLYDMLTKQHGMPSGQYAAFDERTSPPVDPGAGLPPRLRSFARAGQDVKNLVTGEDRIDPAYADAKEFQQVAMSGRTMLAALMAKDPKVARDIIIKAFPDAEPFDDAKGNPMVRFAAGPNEPKRAIYINKPGWSEADFFGVAGDLLTFIPVGRLFSAAAKLPALAGTLGGYVLPMGAAATGTGVQAGVTAALGGDVKMKDVATDALINAALAGTGELVGQIARGGTPRVRLPQPDLGEGRTLAQEAGLNLQAYTDDNLRSLSQLRYMPPGEDRSAAVRSMASYMRGNNIPLTRGQRSGSWTELEKETQARNTPGVTKEFQYFEEGLQDVAINRRARDLAGGHQTDELLGARLQDEVNRLRTQSWQNVEGLYNQVDTHGLRFDASAAPNMIVRVNQRLGDMVDGLAPETSPYANRALAIIRDSTRTPRIDPATGKAMLDPQGNPLYDPVSLTLAQAESLRRRIGTLVQGEGGFDRTATIRIRNAVDDWMNDNLKAGTFSGNAAELAAARRARAAARDHYQTFEPRNEYDVGGDVVHKWNRTGQSVGPAGTTAPSAGGQQAISDVFGPPGSELSGYGDQASIIRRLAEIRRLDPNSTINTDLRDAARFRMLYGRNVDATDTAPAAIAGRVNRGVGSQGRGVTDQLLNRDERMDLLRFAEDLDQLSKRGKGTTRVSNPSGTAYVLGRNRPTALGAAAGGAAGTAIGSAFGPVGMAVGGPTGMGLGAWAGDWANRQLMHQRAFRALNPSPALPPQVPFGETTGDVMAPVLPSIYDQLFR
jgi:hypothetical protein